MYECKFCNKSYEKLNPLSNHQARCKLNPDVISTIYHCNYCGKPSHSRSGTHNHELSCKSNPNRVAHGYNIFDIAQNCDFCGKLCKNANSLRNHERLCKSNPKAQIPSALGKHRPRADLKGKTPWNKGLTKATDERINKVATKLHQDYLSGKFIGSAKGRVLSVEQKKHLSDVAKANQYETHFGRRKIFEYKDIKFISSYEVDVAKSLDANNIKWSIPNRLPYYDTKGKIHYYTADLYLDDYDVYLDPKNDFLINNINPKFGYSDSDKIKWVCEQNDVKILILNKDQLSWDLIRLLIINNFGG